MRMQAGRFRLGAVPRLRMQPQGAQGLIAKLVSSGLSNKEVGQQLNLSAGTIKVHLHNIYQKLGMNNRTTLTALAVSDRYNAHPAVSSGGSLHTQAPHASRLT